MKYTLPILLILICTCVCKAQEPSATIDKIANFPTRFFDKVNNKTAGLEARLERQTIKYLQRLSKKEQKLKRKLARRDSAAAANLFGNSEQQYTQLIQQVSEPTASPGRPTGQYLPYMDSLSTSLNFLKQNNEVINGTKKVKDKIAGSLGQLKELQSKLQQSEQIKAFIRQRKQQIKETLSRYTKLPKGLTNEFNDFNKDIYYYSQQISEYRELLNTPDQLTKRALTLLNRLDAFHRFMSEHSELAGLFGVPANYGSAQSLAGLQTRAQVQQLIQTQLSSAGPNLPTGQAGAQQILQQNIQAAQTQLNQLKDKISKLGSNGGDIDMPDFKPNNQKTKSFLKRLEYGTNLQTTKSNYFFPTTSDLALSAGYKLNDKSTIGIGASYKVGWGKDIRHINITYEGIGLRSYADVKLKGSFYASGGFEYNYQQPFESLAQINSISMWQQSGLIGISKVVSLKSKLFKKTKMQLLWDFLSYQQVPRTQAVKFRVGYNF
jgi:hypothetical protein